MRGKGLADKAVGHGSWDHPRTCGEKAIAVISAVVSTGSPPHMRGKAENGSNGWKEVWITPAHAGKRTSTHGMDVRSGDHPRTCGEKSSIVMVEWAAQGSPPHMRGKVAGAARRDFLTGITPAHAGKRLKRSRSIVPHAAIVPLFPSVCNKPAGSDGSPAGHDAPPFLPIENAVPASPAYNLRSL